MTVLVGPQGPVRVLVVGHFPPPVHGMAVAVARLTGAIEEHATVRRVCVAAPSLIRSPGYHLVRVLRVLRCLVHVTDTRGRTCVLPESALCVCRKPAGRRTSVPLLLGLVLWTSLSPRPPRTCRGGA